MFESMPRSEPNVAEAPPAPPPRDESKPSRGTRDRGSAPPHRARVRAVKVGALVFFLAAVLGCLVAAAVATGFPLNGLGAAAVEKTVGADPPLGVELVKGVPHTLRVPEDVRAALGIRKKKEDLVAVARTPTEKQPLVLSGSTALDPSRLVRVRAAFAPAKVVDIGRVLNTTFFASAESTRELAPGDRVKRGDVLGVFYSVDVGSKKHDLIEALVQLKLDEEILERALAKQEVVPEVFILSARRNVDTDRSAVNRALNTLKTWGIPEEDIEAARQEANRLSQAGAKRDREKDERWARVVLRAPRDGTIIEQNVTLNETVIDNTLALFQIADVDQMIVLANGSEDDLPALLKLPPQERRWTIRTLGSSRGDTISGAIEEFGYLIDVNQHSAVLKGRIPNPDGKLRAGQYVTATILMPPPPDVVEVPTGALVDDGKQSVVFVQPDPAKAEYTMRRVEVVRRFERTAYVRSRLPTSDRGQPPEEKGQGLLPRQALRPGERVLTAGILELKKELEDREAEQR